MSGIPLPPIVVELVIEAAGAALGAFVRTTAGMLALGITAAIAAYWHAASGEVWRGGLAAMATLGICAIAGVVLATKRAALLGVRELVRRHRVGGRVVETVFDRIAALPGAAAAERIPLAQAEQSLQTAVGDVVDGGGFLRRRIAARLVASVQRLTHARFRQDSAQEGGVDLALVRAELANRADELVDAQVTGAARRLTLALVLSAIILSAAASLAIARL